jgi:hypothetical protein
VLPHAQTSQTRLGWILDSKGRGVSVGIGALRNYKLLSMLSISHHHLGRLAETQHLIYTPSINFNISASKTRLLSPHQVAVLPNTSSPYTLSSSLSVPQPPYQPSKCPPTSSNRVVLAQSSRPPTTRKYPTTPAYPFPTFLVLIAPGWTPVQQPANWPFSSSLWPF